MLQVVFQSGALCFSTGRCALVALLLLALPALAQTQPPGDLRTGSQIDAQAALDHSTGGLTFIENLGQWDAEARYLVRVGGLDAWVTDSGLVFDFYERIPAEVEELDSRSLMMGEEDDARLTSADSRRGHVVRMQFEGAAAGDVAGTHRREGYHNYFLGDDPSRWASYVPLYGEVMVSELYEGVGMRLYDDGGFLRYDLLTEPGADLSQVRLRLEGAGAVWVTPEGDLAIETSLGEVRQAGLLAYQEIDGSQVAVSAVFTVLDDGVVGFEVEPLDPSLPLVIDPLIYSTFLGGAGSGHPDGFLFGAIAVDASGSAFVAGWTTTASYPTTPGAYQTTYTGHATAFVTKLDPSGALLAYSTFLGGTSPDIATAIDVDASGNAFVAGWTSSVDFPTTPGAYQTTHPGGFSAFVAKLDASGSDLVYSTFLGEGGENRVRDIAIDASGNAFVAGWTSSDNFPTTDGAYQTTYPGGERSSFVTKLDADGAGLVYSTYLGGAARDHASAIAIDTSGNAFVAGWTASSNFPTTEGAYQTSNPGNFSVFVMKLDPSGASLVYSTYLGGSRNDIGRAIAVDTFGNAFVTGRTQSSNFPTTEDAYQTTFPGNPLVYSSAFVSKFNASGTDLYYSTFLGEARNDEARAIALDSPDSMVGCVGVCVIVAGWTASPNFPTSENAYQTSHPGSTSAFVARLDINSSGLAYSTFLGGSSQDIADGVAIDVTGNVLVVGETMSSNFPTTEGAFQTTHPQGRSAFVTKLDIPDRPVSTEPEGSLPPAFALKSNYPNPFAVRTQIRFAVPHATEIRLEAFDLLGRRVAIIAKEHFEAGTHERVFDASTLRTGVYIVRMTGGDFSQSRRVVVVR